MPGGVLARLQGVGGYIAEREVGHRIAAGLVQQYDVLAVDDPGVTEPDAHATAQRLGEQHPVGQRIGDQEPADRRGRERSLLPGEAHRLAPFGVLLPLGVLFGSDRSCSDRTGDGIR